MPKIFSEGIYFSQPLITPASIAKRGLFPKILFWYSFDCFENNSQEGKDITLILSFSFKRFLEVCTAISTSEPVAKIVASLLSKSNIG